jgi:DnaJ-related protein SCJ1
MSKVVLKALLFAFLCSSVLLAPSYYDILQVSKGSSTKQIKSAYRKLSKIHHPDRNDSPGAREKFAEISEGR